jgi:SAM-dependent methyltransferase
MTESSDTSAGFPRLDIIQNFPGWQKARPFLEDEIRRRGLSRILDIGGGANPQLSETFVREQGIAYTLLDISQEELDKAPGYCRKIQVDLAAPAREFVSKVGENQFDLVFSSMLLEHVREPLAAHRNIYSALRPGGLAIHFFPSAANLPLAINRVLPESVTHRLVRIAQPRRDLNGHQVKFPAYYRMCGSPSPQLQTQFRQMGYKVLRHTGYIGHGYYKRFPLLRDAERALRPILVKLGVPMTGAVLLILQK